MALRTLLEYLNDNEVKYICINHSPAYTAQEIAASAHVPGRELAKTVIFKLDGKLKMAVVPANESIDFERLAKLAGAHNAELADEGEFQDLFPYCETGAMPPFGNLYDMDVYVDEELTKDEKIAFNAGSHNELMQIEYEDFEDLVHPRIGSFGYQA
jgi:Ala-tRNA(Pro) deacylase